MRKEGEDGGEQECDERRPRGWRAVTGTRSVGEVVGLVFDQSRRLLGRVRAERIHRTHRLRTDPGRGRGARRRLLRGGERRRRANVRREPARAPVRLDCE